MKNKALTYGLLIVVAAIWYQVFFRVKNNLLGDTELAPPPSTNRAMLTPIARDTFDLKANYQDPFGEGKKRHVSNAPNINPSRPPVRRNVPPREISWPSMQYYGLVRKTNSKTPLAILKVDGLQLMLRKGDELFNGIYINQIWRDSVQVRRKKDHKTLIRNK